MAAAASPAPVASAGPGPDPGHGPAAEPRPSRIAILAATIGCGLEFYDFITFAFFAVQIGAAFFPSGDHYLSLMGALATFGAGFVARPVGAQVLGGLADRVGRRPVMLLSMSLMGLAITVLALTPGYARIGLAAPVVAIAARLVQGFALGGEVGASTVYMVEAGAAARRGWNASLQGVAQYIASTAGALVGLAVSAALSEAQVASFGWRLALLLGASVVPFALAVRRALPETGGAAVQAPAFAQAQATTGASAIGARPDTAPVKGAGTGAGPSLRQVVWLGGAIMASATIATYIFDYTATFGETQLHMSTRTAMAGQLAANAVGIVGCLAGGWASDRWGRRALLVWPQAAFCALIVPAFVWLLAEKSLTALVTVNLVLGFLSNLITGPLLATLTESLSPGQRARVFSLVYAVPIALFGGTTQLVVTWLLKAAGTPMAIAWYLMAVSVAGLVAMLALPESAPRGRVAVAAAEA
ncbi:MFS transporter [Caulobacter sp. KR2-114]|uniref:MFS transporter n=1 Tax=Caulobacter sp. KR2-114 TaxID=3400912 RepID=UPI003BFFBE6A